VQIGVASFRVIPRSSAAKNRQTNDSFPVCSVCCVVSDGFRLKTPLLNKCMRDLPGLKPRLRFLDRGATNARANRGHVIPRHSAFFRGQKKDQREILCAAADCMAAGVDCDRGRAKLPLSRAVRQDAERRGSAGALRSQAGGRLGRSLALPRGRPAWRETRNPEGLTGSAGASQSRGGGRCGIPHRPHGCPHKTLSRNAPHAR
jgi:hypothetical protein